MGKLADRVVEELGLASGSSKKPAASKQGNLARSQGAARVEAVRRPAKKKEVEAQKAKAATAGKKRRGASPDAGRKKRSRKTSPSSSEEESSSSSDSGSSSDSSQPDDSSAEAEGEDMTAEQQKEKLALDKKWRVLNGLWPKENRPLSLQKKEDIKELSLDLLMVCKAEYRREEEERAGTEKCGRDKKLKATKYKAMTDDGERKFHPARWERLPAVDPAKYCRKWPVKREPIFRHIPLQHYGIEGQVAEGTIVRMHNRATPVELDAMTREKVSSIINR